MFYYKIEMIVSRDGHYITLPEMFRDITEAMKFADKEASICKTVCRVVQRKIGTGEFIDYPYITNTKNNNNQPTGKSINC